MSLLLCFAVGVRAEIIKTTPAAGKQYKIKCIATDHTGYLGDDGTTLQGRHATGTWFVLESNGTEGQYYLKSVLSGKYINAASNTSGSAISFDETATTYWTLDQTNANTAKYSWAIRPSGTAGVSLNNNGDATNACPYMKVNVHNSNTQGCDLWTFDDGVEVPFTKPAFGGTVWTWNTSTNVFDATGKESTARPGRADNKGPVYKFENVGTVTTTGTVDTSDNGGIWVIGSTSNVTSNLGTWAGSILVEDYAVASVNYSFQLKGTEADGAATVWTNGTLSITNRTDFNMADGGGQRWYIGENGVINTGFTSVTKGTRNWELNVVVGNQPERTDQARTTMTLNKKVMTWGADISGDITSIKVWYRDDEGNLTKLDAATAVQHDATGITIVYEGLGYDEKEPSLPADKYVSVSSTKADFLAAAENAADNSHWYILTQTRNGESPVYDNGANTLMRASTTTDINGLTPEDSKQYLVRFFSTDTEGVYDIQFATGKYITGSLTTGIFAKGARYKLYNINGTATHIGWNKYNGGFGSIVDNNGAGATLAFWDSGEVTSLDGNNDWSLYPVEFVDGVTIAYTLNDVNGESYAGTYVTGWGGQNSYLPTLGGVAGYTLSNVNFVKDGENYTATMNITFPFPVSSATHKNATGIRSVLGSATWRARLNSETSAYEAYTTNSETNITVANANEFVWYIYPSFNEGVFSFKLHNKAANMYMPEFAGAQTRNTVNALVAAESAGSFYYLPCTGNYKGFSINPEGTVFLTINTGSEDNQPIWAWTKSGDHQGSNLTFPTIAKSEEVIRPTFEALKAVTPFDILEGSIVQGPSEFASPTDINTAIAAAQSVDDTDVQAMYDFNTGTNGQMIQNYLNQVATYGALFNHQFTVAHQYGTIILPCPSTKPEGITFYSCSATEEDGTTLTLVDGGNMEANKPYIFESSVGNKYTIIGWDKGNRANHENGWLRGSLAETGASVPAGSYVLAANKTTGKQAFYLTDGSVTCPQFKCYLTVPGGSGTRAFYFDGNGETTGIESIFGGNDEETVIFDLAGRRLNKLQKGVNIVNGRKVLVK